MCGIAGVVSPEPGDRSAEVVKSMLKSLAHRGPDDEGLAADTHATIGARRLSIIDIAGGHQPMSNETGEIIAVNNGEIYNYEQLRDELAARGHRFKTHNDTEVLPHAYEEWGPMFVRRLRGMFAIAVWDGRQRILFLARDRLGEKPLVYASQNGALVFASEMQAVLSHPRVSWDIDDLAIAEYLALGYIRAPRSAFSAIRKIPAGHYLISRDGRHKIERYWSLPFAPKLKITRNDAAEELRRLIDGAVRARLMSDVPLGAFLSGGLDSSTVVAFMARHSPHPVKTFTIGFKDEQLNELSYARTTSMAFGTEHHEFVVDGADVSPLPSLVRNLGEPFADPSVVPTYHVARITRASVTVSLSGDGGDELFGGYNRYRLATTIGGLAHLPLPLLRTLPKVGAALPASLWRVQRILAALGASAEQRHLQWSSHYVGSLWQSVIGERVAGRLEQVVGDELRTARDLTGASDPADEYMASDTLTYLPDDLLAKVDIASMANSLESRAPFLDHELAEFAARLPSDYKVSPFGTKLLLRSAMRGILPARILARGKMGFTPPVASWLRGPLNDLLRDCVNSSIAVERGYLSRDGLRDLLDADLRIGRRGLLLWSVLMLELWLREFGRSR